MFDYPRDTVAKRPNQVAFIITAKMPVLGRLSHYTNCKELEDNSNALAAYFVEQGLKKGDKVAIVMPNCTAFGITYWAVVKVGGVVAATNPTYPADKMEYQINDCDAEFVVTLSVFYSLIKQVQPKTKVKQVIVSNIKEYLPSIAKWLFTLTREKKDGHRVTSEVKDAWFQGILKSHAGKTVSVNVSPDDLALFQYTGGTTGVSKGAMATHRALVANTEMLQTWTDIKSGSCRGVPNSELIFLGAIPMFYAYGLVALLT